MPRASEAFLRYLAIRLVQVILAEPDDMGEWLAEGSSLTSLSILLAGETSVTAVTSECSAIDPLHRHLWLLVRNLREAELDSHPRYRELLGWIVPTLESIGLCFDSSYCDLRAMQASVESVTGFSALLHERAVL